MRVRNLDEGGGTEKREKEEERSKRMRERAREEHKYAGNTDTPQTTATD
jgi:hypothetical protein